MPNGIAIDACLSAKEGWTAGIAQTPLGHLIKGEFVGLMSIRAHAYTSHRVADDISMTCVLRSLFVRVIDALGSTTLKIRLLASPLIVELLVTD